MQSALSIKPLPGEVNARKGGGMLARSFFQRDPRTVAQALLGSGLACGETAGKVVETEAYSTIDDPACHTAFRNQARDFVKKEKPGAAYIYLNYGVYHLLNILTKAADGELGFVLIRALEPVAGLERMRNRRGKSRAQDLCSGPGKLTIALGIGPQFHGGDLCHPSSEIVFSKGAAGEPVLIGPRIGITKAADFPWRYGLASPHLSRPFPKAR